MNATELLIIAFVAPMLAGLIVMAWRTRDRR